MPTLLFLLLFCGTFVTMGQRIVQISSGTAMTFTGIDLWAEINPVLPRCHERYSYA